MSTTIVTRPSIHLSRRVLLGVALAVTLAFGAGAAAVDLTSADHTTVRDVSPVSVAKASDVQALWNQLSTLPAHERDAIVTNLDPGVRSQLRAIAEAIASSAEHH